MIRHIDASPLAAAQGATPMSTARQQKLSSAAHEFEASLMQEFLKPLQHDALFSDKANDEDSDNSDGPGGSEGALLSMGSEVFAKALSEHGGFGIANRILAQLGASASPSLPREASEPETDRSPAAHNSSLVNEKAGLYAIEKKPRSGSGNAESGASVNY